MADKPKLVPVKLFYDYWPAEDDRKRIGEVTELPLDQAKSLIAAGKAERADPLPGDE